MWLLNIFDSISVAITFVGDIWAFLARRYMVSNSRVVSLPNTRGGPGSSARIACPYGPRMVSKKYAVQSLPWQPWAILRSSK